MNMWQSSMRNAIRNKGMSITKFADVIGVSRITIYNVMNNRIYTKRLLIRICDELGLDVVELVKFDYIEELMNGEKNKEKTA